MTPLNLDRLQHWIDRGLIDPSKPVTMKELHETRCVHGIKYGVKLLADVSPSSLSL
jgi:large subunit ribosomal protein L15